MKNRFLPFNIYLAVVLALTAGCRLMPKKKELTRLGISMEVTPDNTGRNGPVTIGRTDPFVINVEHQPFLDERNVAKASVVEPFGGYQIALQLDRRGTWLLEQYTLANRGRRIAIVTHFDDQTRWLAAPVIPKPITDGWMVFTPDATREEADRIVRGLNQVAKTAQKNNP